MLSEANGDFFHLYEPLADLDAGHCREMRRNTSCTTYCFETRRQNLTEDDCVKQCLLTVTVPCDSVLAWMPDILKPLFSFTLPFFVWKDDWTDAQQFLYSAFSVFIVG